MRIAAFIIAAVLVAGTAFAQQESSGSVDETEQPDDRDEQWGDEEDDDWGDDWGDDWEEEASSPWHGFAELGIGVRLQEDKAVGRSVTLWEARWRIERFWELNGVGVQFRGDLLGDAVIEEVEAEVRELYATWRLGSLDIKAGRQILTWGTGDFLFLNDLFPKGWESFFIGRDDEYLKAPSDAIRLTQYNDLINIDVAIAPFFNPDEYLTGERLSFFWPPVGDIAAPDPPLIGREPSTRLDNTEYAARLFRTFGSGEFALYAFDGFYHQPWPFGPGGALAFPGLRALGASWRQPLGPGLVNAEVSRYYSKDDRSGTNPAIPNDQIRFLLGYEWEAIPNLTVGFQYYQEWTQDHEALLENSPWPEFEVAEHRTWLTNRLTLSTRQNRMLWSLFTFYGTTDRDFYLRPEFYWRISDEWSLNVGGNLLGGPEKHTFFAQFEDNSNVYARIRYAY
jgi:hypothetical protein